MTNDEIIDLVVQACARGRRQEEFLQDEFGRDGAVPANYTNIEWSLEWRKSLDNLLSRLLNFFASHSYLRLVLVKISGPRGGWWSGPFIIRQLPAEEKEVP